MGSLYADGKGLMADRSIIVGMAEIHAIKSSAQFSCMGLGSCVGVCALDPLVGVGGMVHVMLPEAPTDKVVDRVGKFANTGVPEMIARMKDLGADESRIRVAIVGGAQVAKFGAAPSPMSQIGDRNVRAVGHEIARLGLRLVKADVGGNLGRTVQFDIGTGVIKVRTVNRGERELCSLREAA